MNQHFPNGPRLETIQVQSAACPARTADGALSLGVKADSARPIDNRPPKNFRRILCAARRQDAPVVAWSADHATCPHAGLAFTLRPETFGRFPGAGSGDPRTTEVGRPAHNRARATSAQQGSAYCRFDPAWTCGASQIRTVWSPLAVASVFPSGEKATDATRAVCPSKRARGRPVETSQRIAL